MSNRLSLLSRSEGKILQRSNILTFTFGVGIIEYGRAVVPKFMVPKSPPSEASRKAESSIINQMRKSTKNPKLKHSRQKVIDLEPNSEVGRLELVVLRRYPRRLVSSTNFTGSVAAACGRDETGIVGIVLWGEQVNTVNTGDIIRIESGWCKQRSGELVVSTGRSGRLTVIDR